MEAFKHPPLQHGHLLKVAHAHSIILGIRFCNSGWVIISIQKLKYNVCSTHQHYDHSLANDLCPRGHEINNLVVFFVCHFYKSVLCDPCSKDFKINKAFSLSNQYDHALAKENPCLMNLEFTTPVEFSLFVVFIYPVCLLYAKKKELWIFIILSVWPSLAKVLLSRGEGRGVKLHPWVLFICSIPRSRKTKFLKK